MSPHRVATSGRHAAAQHCAPARRRERLQLASFSWAASLAGALLTACGISWREDIDGGREKYGRIKEDGTVIWVPKPMFRGIRREKEGIKREKKEMDGKYDDSSMVLILYSFSYMDKHIYCNDIYLNKHIYIWIQFTFFFILSAVSVQDIVVIGVDRQDIF